MMLKNLERLGAPERAELRISASRIKKRYGVST
jgi:hypothetical protein